MSRPKVFTIAASAHFAESLAGGLIARAGRAALDDAIIYLPTRRAARTFGEAFAQALGGAALLPQLRPLGDVEEDDLLFDAAAEALELAPAIAPMRRQLLLATLIRQWSRARGADVLSFAQAAALAESLGAVMDEIERQDADLSRLGELAPAHLAQHWQEVAYFLEQMRDLWPAQLAAEGVLSAEARRSAALDALGRRLERDPPPGPVIAAGSTGSIPATARLLGVIARLKQGAVVLPGLDRDLDQASWDALDPGHPQFGLKQLLARIGVAREDVADWHHAAPRPAREHLLRECLRPAPTTDAWRALAESGGGAVRQGLEGLSVVEVEDAAQEALVIALALRETLEIPGRTATLVTPDRTLARRVSSELRRWKIEIDDSGGRPLAHTAAGSFLCLLAEAAGSGFAPVELLALLKHPFASLGGQQAGFRARARELDQCLRGPRPDPGLDGIAAAIRHAADDPRRKKPGDLVALAAWWNNLTAVLRPLERLFAPGETGLEEMVEAHGAAAERLASDESGATRLWSDPDGAEAAKFVADLAAASADLPAVETGVYPSLFRSLAARKTVRTPYATHPRLAILGPLEARLQNFDRTILGGLNETGWPPAAPADPWFSRPMRGMLGLEQPEREIGLAAHDFSTLASGPAVLLTRARKAKGAPAVRSRWLQRLFQLAQGLGAEASLDPLTDYERMAARLGEPKPAPRFLRPQPTPPVPTRPRRLSVTEIETWLRDPYAIYAKHVLRLRPLDELDEEIGPLERGNAVHRALELFVARHPGALPGDAVLLLMAVADEVFDDMGVPKAAVALWRPRFLGAAQWFVAHERIRREGIMESHLEVKGRIAFDAPGGRFELRGTADRIDILKDGGAAILDYKTGQLPKNDWIVTFLTPQLPLEGAILGAGGFDGLAALKTEKLVYLQLSGGPRGGAEKTLENAAVLAAEAEARLRARVAWFDEKTTPYHSRVAPRSAKANDDYDHLARVREWSLAGWGEAKWGEE